MVCIAAFIILCIVGVFVLFISIFKRDIGRRYLKVFKQSLACVGKKATLQKCETGFKDNVKNSLLSRILIKNPKLLKPASVVIEVGSVLIVLVALWSLVESVKAGLALWTLGTCNVEHPASCALSNSVVCPIDAPSAQNPIEYIGQWFSDWGEIFSAIPDKFRSWDANNFDLAGVPVMAGEMAGSRDNLALDIVDPGCVICAQSFRAQMSSGFFDTHSVVLVPYPIADSETGTKFNNSELISRYILAASAYSQEVSLDNNIGYEIIKRIFLEKNPEGVNYQDYFNYSLSQEEARDLLDEWAREFGADDAGVNEIRDLAASDEIAEMIQKNVSIVKNEVHAKGIPTMIYDGSKHTGMFEVRG